MISNLTVNKLYDLDKTQAGEFLSAFTYPWEALSGIKDFIIKLGNTLPENEYYSPKENVWISRSAKIAPNAFIGDVCIIGHDTEVRHCAFIRGSAIVGNGCVVGNSTELKNVILFDKVQVPHFNYVGDSILGFCSHMGAGAVTSNVKSDKSLVVIKAFADEIPTKLKKVGAFLGDFVEIGCNSVLNPGTVIGRSSNIYPTSCVRGFIPENSIYKSKDSIIGKI